MRRRSREVLKVGIPVVGLLLAACGRASGQVDLSQWPKVELTVVATDNKGDPAPVPAADRIVVREDGKQQAAVALSAVLEPASVCILVDTSASMSSRLADLQAAADHFLEALPPEDEVCFASFSWHLELRRHFTQDHAKIETSIHNLQVEGGTSLYDALSGLEDFMRGSAHNRFRFIVLLTDGEDNSSSMDEEQVRRIMGSPGSPLVNIVRIPAARGSEKFPTQEAHDRKTIQTLAGVSGGLTYFPRSVIDMNTSLDQLNQAMKSVFLLEYSTDAPMRDGRERSFEIRLDKDRKTILWAPEAYYAPAQ